MSFVQFVAISLCNLRIICCATCRIFIVQFVDGLLCKLWMFCDASLSIYGLFGRRKNFFCLIGFKKNIP